MNVSTANIEARLQGSNINDSMDDGGIVVVYRIGSSAEEDDAAGGMAGNYDLAAGVYWRQKTRRVARQPPKL